MTAVPANLRSLHKEEESIRDRSIAQIEASEALRDHLQAIHDALDHLDVLRRVPSRPGDDVHSGIHRGNLRDEMHARFVSASAWQSRVEMPSCGVGVDRRHTCGFVNSCGLSYHRVS
jgi:hypothetical protein